MIVDKFLFPFFLPLSLSLQKHTLWGTAHYLHLFSSRCLGHFLFVLLAGPAVYLWVLTGATDLFFLALGVHIGFLFIG